MDNLALTLKNDLSSEHAVKAALVKFCEEVGIPYFYHSDQYML